MKFKGSANIPCQKCGEILTLKTDDVEKEDTATLVCLKCNTNNTIDCKKIRDDLLKELKKKFGDNLVIK